jgi:hypothetical protein
LKRLADQQGKQHGHASSGGLKSGGGPHHALAGADEDARRDYDNTAWAAKKVLGPTYTAYTERGEGATPEQEKKIKQMTASLKKKGKHIPNKD